MLVPIRTSRCVRHVIVEFYPKINTIGGSSLHISSLHIPISLFPPSIISSSLSYLHLTLSSSPYPHLFISFCHPLLFCLLISPLPLSCDRLTLSHLYSSIPTFLHSFTSSFLHSFFSFRPPIIIPAFRHLLHSLLPSHPCLSLPSSPCSFIPSLLSSFLPPFLHLPTPLTSHPSFSLPSPPPFSNDYHTDAWWLASSPVNYHHCEAVDYSERTVINYWLRYCPWALEFDDLETLARIHNGGPCWFRHCKTAIYWWPYRPYPKHP